MNDRRSEGRRICIVQAQVVAEGLNGKPARHFAILEDRSLSGMGLNVHAPLLLGSMIYIKMQSQMFSGVVRHCTKTARGYMVGVELIPGGESSTTIASVARK